MKELFHQDVQTITEKHKQAELMLIETKDQVGDSIPEALEKERAKMEEMHRADLAQKEKQHLANLAEQKKLLEQETKHLEEQLAHQTELRAVLDKLQQRTVDISEIVQSNLKQREEELRKREQALIRAEREVQEELDHEIALEERKVAEEERKLNARKDDVLREAEAARGAH